MNSKYIISIAGETPYTQKKFNIELNGKCLIITGKNGSGKTSFLMKLFETLNSQIKDKKDDQALQALQNNISFWEKKLKENPKGSSQHAQALQQLEFYRSQINAHKQFFDIKYSVRLPFAAGLDDGTAVIDFFEATRQSQISHSNNASFMDEEATKQLVIKNRGGSSLLGQQLEQYLVNLKVKHSFAKNNAETNKKDKNLAINIEQWFTNFNENLKFLIEQDDAFLCFNSDKMQVSIRQGVSQEYTFQQLSSGYSAIFSIYSALLVRVQYLNITPDQLKGVVLIDEIDAHLHLSLQRKILPFLMHSFPNVQFIVSTHSPFVITSVQDTVVYDISRCEQVDEDLSFYSYQVVAEGLLGVDPASDILVKKIEQLAQIIEQNKVTQTLKDLVKELSANYEKLDEESQFFVSRAQLLINRSSGN